MAIRNHTGIIPWRLKGDGGGETQRFQGGETLSWLMKSVPSVTDGKLCNYMLGLIVTVFGSLQVVLGEGQPAHPGSNGARGGIRTMWDVLRNLIASIEVRSAWHGTAISAQHVKGSFLQLIECIGNGLERPYRIRPPMLYDAQASPQPRQYFRYNFFVPLCLLAGTKGHHTALPACMYRNAEFVLNCGSGTSSMFPMALNDVAGVKDCQFQVSALLLPEDEVRVGPAVQWIDYQQKVSGEAVDINGLGTVSTMDRTEKGAGIAGLFWLSNREQLPGPGMVRDISDLTFPFRGIVHTKHFDAIITQLETIMGCKQDVAGAFIGLDGDGSSEASGDVGGFPYDDYDYGTSELGQGYPLALERPNPVVLPLICPTKDLEATKVQQSEGTQQLQIQFRGDATLLGYDPTIGTHHLLACQLHSWTAEAWTSAKQLLIEEGVCRKVLGTDDVDWKLKVLKKNDASRILERKRRFMAMKLLPIDKAAIKVG